MRRAAALCLLVSCAASPPPPKDEVVGDDVHELLTTPSRQHGLRTGYDVVPLPAELVGAIPHRLVGDWSDDTAMVSTTLMLDHRGRFLWEMHGCMGTTYWLGEARVDDGVLLLVPDRPDWAFSGGRRLDLVEQDGEPTLVPRARNEDDRATFPLRRRPAG
jgi:hypothetical protein